MPRPIPNNEKSAHLTSGGRHKALIRALRFAQALPLNELAVYCFILNRTLAYGNRMEEISDEDFSVGTFRKGECICRPVGLPHFEIFEAIAALIDCGAVRLHVVQGFKYYEVNLEWTVPGLAVLPLEERDYHYTRPIPQSSHRVRRLPGQQDNNG